MNTDPIFINDLADAVLEALPTVRTTEKSASADAANSAALAAASLLVAAASDGGGGDDALRRSGGVGLVPAGSVGDLLAAYDRDKMVIPLPDTDVSLGDAETVNGMMAAVIAFVALLVLEVQSGTTGIFAMM